jgi:hypothetical protein
MEWKPVTLITCQRGPQQLANSACCTHTHLTTKKRKLVTFRRQTPLRAPALMQPVDGENRNSLVSTCNRGCVSAHDVTIIQRKIESRALTFRLWSHGLLGG